MEFITLGRRGDRGWTAAGVFISRGGTSEGVNSILHLLRRKFHEASSSLSCQRKIRFILVKAPADNDGGECRGTNEGGILRVVTFDFCLLRFAF